VCPSTHHGPLQRSKHRGPADVLSMAGARITALICARYTRVCPVTDGLSQRAPAGSDYLSLAAMLVVPFCCKRSYPRSRGNPHPHGWQVSRHPFATDHEEPFLDRISATFQQRRLSIIMLVRTTGDCRRGRSLWGQRGPSRVADCF
jgi:hypothetical protein